MKTLKKLSLLTLIALIAVACSKSGTPTPTPDPTPSTSSLTVTAVSPDYGKAGVEVTITGTGFSTTPASNTVTIGGKAASVTVATATSLKITAPADNTHGVVTVKVGTLTANGPTFYYEPEVTSLSATTGKVGDAIIITGKNFSTTAADYEVKFNGVAATITTATATTLTVTVPATATTGVVTVARKTKTAVNGPSFTIGSTPVTPAGGFTVTDGAITISAMLKSNGTYGSVLCAAVDETNNILYAATKTTILKIDLSSNAVTSMVATSSFLSNLAQPSAMDVGPDGKLYLLTDLVTIGGVPTTGGNVWNINTSTNAVTQVGNRYIGINIGGSIADNIPFMVTSDNGFITMDASVGTIVKYSADLTVRTVILTVLGIESFHHLVKRPDNTVRIITTTLTGTGKAYYDYTTSLSAKTELPAGLATEILSTARGGTSTYEVKSKYASDAGPTSTHTLYTIGKLNAGLTDFEKKASFTIDNFYLAATIKYYDSIALNGKTYFYADKNGNMYALIIGLTPSDTTGIFKFTIN